MNQYRPYIAWLLLTLAIASLIFILMATALFVSSWISGQGWAGLFVVVAVLALSAILAKYFMQ